MSELKNTAARGEIVKRLKRAEGQLRGIQRMIEEGTPCLEIAQQFSAVRKALHSTEVRMTMCLLEQELGERLAHRKAGADLAPLLGDLQSLLTRLA